VENCSGGGTSVRLAAGKETSVACGSSAAHEANCQGRGGTEIVVEPHGRVEGQV
jgi:hypothetical protein